MSIRSILILKGTDAKAQATFERFLANPRPLDTQSETRIHPVCIKPAIDKVVAFLALLFLSPLLLYIALRIRLTTSGSIIFRQERLGYGEQPFMIYKFRTMYAEAEAEGLPLLSTASDPRITPFGAFLRRYRLDELPQFWNVLKGDMSLVGPRPERRYFAALLAEQVPAYHLLYNLRPGITSLGMVKYGYASTLSQMLLRLKYDLLYYEHRSLFLDLGILVYTVRTIIGGKGI
ncbi:MAG: sugar transferase [Tannerellaceae bacterium]|jgi:lipopolysaccharide/colanic/teichoic acid biosynthesis glycosyltransferase|nr:sugar transferase [Tannerellaceae bacterium]